jgi:SpoIIAA-like
MLEILPSTGPLVAFRAAQTLSREDYDQLIAALEQQLKLHERIAIYAEIDQLHAISLPTFFRDLGYSLSKLGELHRFARIAVVSDSAWMRAWSQFAWGIAPRSSVRTFPTAEREAAKTWAQQLEPAPVQRGLRWILTKRPDTYGFVWTGTVTQADIEEVVKKLEVEFETHMSVRVFARVERFYGIRPRALLNPSLLRLKLQALRKVERYAIVGDASWLDRYVALVRKLSDIELRHFRVAQESEAWTWLEAAPDEVKSWDGGDTHVQA